MWNIRHKSLIRVWKFTFLLRALSWVGLCSWVFDWSPANSMSLFSPTSRMVLSLLCFCTSDRVCQMRARRISSLKIGFGFFRKFKCPRIWRFGEILRMICTRLQIWSQLNQRARVTFLCLERISTLFPARNFGLNFCPPIYFIKYINASPLIDWPYFLSEEKISWFFLP